MSRITAKKKHVDAHEEIMDLKPHKKRLEKFIKEITSSVKEEMITIDCSEIAIGKKGRTLFSMYQQTRFDESEFAKDHPRLYKKYKKKIPVLKVH